MYFINLEGREPIFRGTDRLVYVHPEESSLLVKVRSERRETIRRNNIPHWKQRFKPMQVADNVHMREIRELVRINSDSTAYMPHILMMVGYLRTNLGWGQVVKAEYDVYGNYAPTLQDIIHEVERYQKPLEEFLQWLRETNIIFFNIHPWNLVLAHRNGKDEIVAIDNIGEKTVIPLRTYFPALNKRKNAKAAAEFYQIMEQIKRGTPPARDYV